MKADMAAIIIMFPSYRKVTQVLMDALCSSTSDPCFWFKNNFDDDAQNGTEQADLHRTGQSCTVDMMVDVSPSTCDGPSQSHPET